MSLPAFPAEYRNAIFVARHGYWNWSKKFDGDIALVSLNQDGTVKSVDPFITGFIEDNSYIGRPADLLVLKDGSLLISDDFNGAVYRATERRRELVMRARNGRASFSLDRFMRRPRSMLDVDHCVSS